MKKTFRLIGIVIMAIICCGLTACGGDDDDSNNGAISEYVGSWSCTSPATYILKLLPYLILFRLQR